MKTKASRELYAYWDQRRGSRAAPERGDIDPRAIRGTLADTFFLSWNPAAGHPFRLAGTRICALCARELKDRSFLSLWNSLDAPQIAGLIETLAAETIGVVAGATARTELDLWLDLELLLLPIYDHGGINSQVLGVLTPLQIPYWLGVHAIADLSLTSFRHVGHDIGRPSDRRLPLTGPPRLPTRPHLIVHAGGRI